MQAEPKKKNCGHVVLIQPNGALGEMITHKRHPAATMKTTKRIQLYKVATYYSIESAELMGRVYVYSFNAKLGGDAG